MAERDLGDKYLWKCGIYELVMNQLNQKYGSLGPKLKQVSQKCLRLQGAEQGPEEPPGQTDRQVGITIQPCNNHHQGSVLILLAPMWHVLY